MVSVVLSLGVFSCEGLNGTKFVVPSRKPCCHIYLPTEKRIAVFRPALASRAAGGRSTGENDAASVIAENTYTPVSRSVLNVASQPRHSRLQAIDHELSSKISVISKRHNSC